MPHIACMSHILGATVFLAASTIFYFHKHTRQQVPLFIVSACATVLWCLCALLYIKRILPFYGIVAASEIFQDISWCFCIISLINSTQNTQGKRWFNNPLFKILLISIIGILFINAFFLQARPQQNWINIFVELSFVGNITLSVVGLALIEQLYVGLLPERREGIKYIAIGLGLMFCYDFYLFSNALMLNYINIALWEMRGGVCALTAPFIIVGVLRNTHWQNTLMPSRKLIFSSTAFISCGIYLLIMASVGYGIRQFGGNWGKALQILFLSGSLLVLALLLTSGNVRAVFTQFFARNIFKLRYDYRHEWLNISNILSQSDHKDIHQLAIKMVADLVESPKGWLFEKTKNNDYRLIDGWNTDLPEKPILLDKKALVEYLDLVNKPINVQKDLIELPDQVAEESWIWLLVPLKYLNECSYVVALAYPRVNFSINWEVQDILMMAGRQLAVTLVQAKNAKELLIAKQFEAFNQVSAFIAHDLKNIAAQLILLSNNKNKHGDNPAFVKSVYQTIDNLTVKFEVLLKQFTSKTKNGSEIIGLKKVIKNAISLRSHLLPIPQLQWALSESEIKIMGNMEDFINVLCHLLENAQQATASDGSIIVKVTRRNTQVNLWVIDSGKGMSNDFIQTQLFKPFVSTKGRKGMGIGVYQAKTYVEQHGGTITATAKEGKGAMFVIQFPIVKTIQENTTIENKDPEHEIIF